MSKIIGLTGGIASGKSYASEYLWQLGFPIIDCDKISNSLYEKKEYIQELIETFGPDILDKGEFSKKKLSHLVFSNKKQLEKLNTIAFPLILNKVKEKLKEYSHYDVVIIDAPTLVESLLFHYIKFDKVLLIDTWEDTQITRLMERNNLTQQEALTRIHSQLSYQQKNAILTDFMSKDNINVIRNIGTFEDFKTQLNTYSKNIIEELNNVFIQEIEDVKPTEKIVVYAGSFDPITYGHIDIIKKAAKSFDKVVVGILVNETKKPMLSLSIREEMIKTVIKEERLNNAEVKCFDGLLVDFMEEVNSNILIRGLRTSEDFIYEQRNYLVNKDLSPNIETHYFMSNPEYIHVSSSLVRALLNQSFEEKYIKIQKYVPDYLIKYLQ